MEEFQQLSSTISTISLQEKKQQRKTTASPVLTDDEVCLLLRTSRIAVEQLMERCSEAIKIGQSECKGVRDLIGASSNLSSAFHPPSDLILEEVSLLVDTLMIALASSKVPVEFLILFGTALVQTLVIGPCILKRSVCQKCADLKGRDIASAVHSRVKEKYYAEMGSLQPNDSTSLLAKIIAPDWLVPSARTDSFELTLRYAYVMSSTRLHNLGEEIQLELLVSSEIYDVIFRECSKYSKLTTLAFKTLASWLEKVSEFGLSLSSQVTRQAFTITSSSWEVSLSGVRKDNAIAFSTLLSIDSVRNTPFLPSTDDLLKAAIKQQLWSDVSKYYAITELVGIVTAPKVLEKYGDEIVEGLTTSFRNNQLAAAGAHLYESLLRQLTLFYWNKYFLHPILQLIEDIDGPSARRLRKLQTDKLARSASAEKIRTIQLNILNYWLRITANIFPDALTTLRQETYENIRSTNFESHDHLAFLSAGVLFISRKKGLWDPISDSEFRKMGNYRDEITSETFFKTVCVSCKISDEIRQEEFEMILEYLRHHINVDSTRMRQEMTRSMKTFFHRFHVSNVHHQKLQSNEVIPSAKKFLAEVSNFLSENLTEDISNGKRISYQRRIASLQIYLELLRSVNNTKSYKIPIGDTPCALQIKNWHSNPQQQKTLANCIDDQTDNIQNTAFSILKETINKTYESLSWLDTGLQKCHHPKSHVAQSGVLYILLASQSLYSQFEKSDLVDAKLEEIYPGYKKIYSSFNAVKTPVTLAVFNIGLELWEEFKSKPMELTKMKSLHGIIDTVTAVVLKSEGPEFRNLESSFQETLLQFVEDISNFCVSMFMSSTENKDCAPSFAEMGKAIKLAAKPVDDRSTRVDDEYDEIDDDVNTSSDERLLVKHLWLNLKACCNFAANVDGSAEIVQKSLNILIHVLRRCRHKGAIEAAGESLQHLIGAITKVPKSGEKGTASAEKRSLPLLVLKDFMEDLVSGRTAHKTSTTRRSAGLAIFVHHIVIGDADPDRPLLKVALSQLISALNVPMLDLNVNESDLPQAQTLHILRTLVADASLRVTLTPYINVVAKSALVYLTSTVWSVRNGALQLFGALVPILIGQESSLADFYFLHKDLFETLLNFVETATVSDCLLQTHSDAVPTLVMLSRLTAPQLFSSEDLIQNVQRLRSVYFKLLGSEIMSVRSLAARGLSRINSIDDPSQMVQEIKKWLEGNRSQNAIHGALLALQFIWERCQTKQSSDLSGDVAKLIEFIYPLARSKLSSDLLLKINTNILNKKNNSGKNGVHTIEFLKTMPEELNIDQTRKELEDLVHQVLDNPSLSSEALKAVLIFLQNHSESSNDIIISALTTAQQLIIVQIQNLQLDEQIDQLFKLLKKLQNQSVRSAAFVVLLGLINLSNSKFYEIEKVIQLFLSELKLCCSFSGNREPNNQFKMAEALRYLASFLEPTIARDFLNSVIFFLQSDDSDIRDETAEIISRGRCSHTECLLKLLDPCLIRVYCKTDFVIALSLCDRLLFSDDEMLISLGDVCGGYNVDIWRRESPYLEDWYVADEAYRQLDSFLDGREFTKEHLNEIVKALQLNEIKPFLKECERLNFDLGSSNVELAMKTSPFIKNHRKWLFRTKLQEKCQRFLQN